MDHKLPHTRINPTLQPNPTPRDTDKQPHQGNNRPCTPTRDDTTITRPSNHTLHTIMSSEQNLSYDHHYTTLDQTTLRREQQQQQRQALPNHHLPMHTRTNNPSYLPYHPH